MKLNERLPNRITAGGKTYKVDLDFRNVLRFMDLLARDDLLPGAREYLALKCVMRHPPRKDARAVMDAVKAVLFPETKKSAGGQKLTDFEQDADLIRAAFRQAYGIDLYRDTVHWVEFSALLNALPEGSRYAEVLGIRARPMPKATKWNTEEREWLIRAKAQCALKMSDQDQSAHYEQCVINIFRGLMTMAEKGDKDA